MIQQVFRAPTKSIDGFIKVSFHELLFSIRSDLLRIGIEGTPSNQFILSPITLTSPIIQTDKDSSSVFKNVSVLHTTKPVEYGQSSERIRPCPMSIAWWKNLDESSFVVTVDGHSLGFTTKFTNQQEYASP